MICLADGSPLPAELALALERDASPCQPVLPFSAWCELDAESELSDWPTPAEAAALPA